MKFAPVLAALVVAFGVSSLSAQSASPQDVKAMRAKLSTLEKKIAGLKRGREDVGPVADVEICAKAAEWILRHEEFYKPEFAKWTLETLDLGLKRAENLAAGKRDWIQRPGKTVHGYYSRVDGSVQPFAVTVPEGVDPKDTKRWPLYVVLHGRDGTLNEVKFIHTHDGKSTPAERTWIQLDVFGRVNNAYRFSGETDVFEALAAVRRLYRVDDRRIALWGFSMGGAGAWHLGLHHPSQWASVGAGAGFVDFHRYQNRTEKLPDYQDKTLRIYDAIDYALNAFDVPIVGYGGELDKQLLAAKSMSEKAKKLGVPIKLIVGPGVEHKFHPDSLKEFMAFHAANIAQGRPMFPGPDEIRFITWTPKYNECHWLTVEELIEQYAPATVEAKVENQTGVLTVKTQNIAAMQIARDVAESVRIDGGDPLPLQSAAESLLPNVYYQRVGDDWKLLNYEESRKFSENPALRKRHNLQGPIDDAFMEPFVCVEGTGRAWSEPHEAWARWTLDRFRREFDKWLRGRVPTVKDTQVNEELIESKNLVLFGDPGSNSVLARIVKRLPVEWTKDGLTVNGRKYDPDTHGVALIYPNPLNPSRYVVINSGHTFHEPDFKASNANLYPRLGDIAVLAFEKRGDEFREKTEWAALFDSGWKLK